MSEAANEETLEYSRDVLDKMYSELKISDEMKNLLSEYFKAFNNLYYILPLKKAFEIINSQNEEKISREDFLEFCEVVRHDRKFYYILGDDDIYDDEPKCDPMDRRIIKEYLMEDDLELYENMLSEKSDRRYYIPEKEELFKYYKEELRTERDEYYNALYDFFAERYIVNMENVMDSIIYTVKNDENDIISALEMLDLCGCDFNSEKLEMAEALELLRLYVDFFNNTRLPMLNGFKPKELGLDYYSFVFENELDEKDVLEDMCALGYVKLEPQRSKKIGRNDPCPCGSGKKYKKCCGIGK
jgi:hypothetical protein